MLFRSALSATPPTTSAVVAGLTAGVPYYFVVTATNFTDRTSAYSSQAFGIPLLYEGAAPPD